MKYLNSVFESLPPPDAVPRALMELRLLDIGTLEKIAENDWGKITGFWLKPFQAGFRLWVDPSGFEAKVTDKQIALRFSAPIIPNAKAFKILNNSLSRFMVLVKSPESTDFKVWGAYTGLALSLTENPKPESGSKAWMIEAVGHAQETLLALSDAADAVLGGVATLSAIESLITIPGNVPHELSLEGLWLNTLQSVFLGHEAIPFQVDGNTLKLKFKPDMYSGPVPLRLFSARGLSVSPFKIFRP